MHKFLKIFDVGNFRGNSRESFVVIRGKLSWKYLWESFVEILLPVVRICKGVGHNSQNMSKNGGF